MGKHYELKADKAEFLIKLWCREHGLELDKLVMFPPEETAQRLKEWGMSETST